MSNEERQNRFIEAVAELLTHDVGTKSIKLQMRNEDAILWAKAYSATNCLGYATKEECADAIRKLFTP